MIQAPTQLQRTTPLPTRQATLCWCFHARAPVGDVLHDHGATAILRMSATELLQRESSVSHCRLELKLGSTVLNLRLSTACKSVNSLQTTELCHQLYRHAGAAQAARCLASCSSMVQMGFAQCTRYCDKHCLPCEPHLQSRRAHWAACSCNPVCRAEKSGRHGMFCPQGRSHLQYMKCRQHSLAHAVLSASETAMLHACVNFRAHTCDAMGRAHLRVGRARHTCYMLTAACSRKTAIDRELHTSLLWSQPDTPLLWSMRWQHCGCCSWLSRLRSRRRHSALQHTSPTDQQTCFTAFRL